MKLGRKPRAFDSRIPHMSALLAAAPMPPPPAQIDYSPALPADTGTMLNNSLGCCTCASVYHAFQVWSANANPPIDTEPDSDVELLYEKSCGYDPDAGLINGENPTDQGGVEQEVLTYLLNDGAPVGADGSAVRKISAFVEVDPRNTDDVKWTIVDFGVAYIGMRIPAYIMATTPPAVWDVDASADNSIIGGHAVIVVGYDANGLKFVSWGQLFTMTWAFWAANVDEAYAIADAEWIAASGIAPCGQTLAQLEALMVALKAA